MKPQLPNGGFLHVVCGFVSWRFVSKVHKGSLCFESEAISIDYAVCST